MSPLFTREASGHNPRTAKALRMRNRVSHKYWYAPDYSDGRFACTGCGRCISSARCRWTSVKLSSTPSRMTRKPNKESEHGRDAQSLLPEMATVIETVQETHNIKTFRVRFDDEEK